MDYAFLTTFTELLLLNDEDHGFGVCRGAAGGCDSVGVGAGWSASGVGVGSAGAAYCGEEECEQKRKQASDAAETAGATGQQHQKTGEGEEDCCGPRRVGDGAQSEATGFNA